MCIRDRVYIDTVMLMGTIGTSMPVDERPWFVMGAASASFAWFASLGFGARFLAPLFAQPITWRMLDLLIALMMAALAVSLLQDAFIG